MIGFLRLGFFGFLFLTVIYILVSVYSRSIRREKLEVEWDEEIKAGDRDAFIAKGMKNYDTSLRKKLIFLVYVVPVIVVVALVYVLNFM